MMLAKACPEKIEGAIVFVSSHFKMKNEPGDYDKWGFVTSIGPHSIFGGWLSISSEGECGRRPFNIFTFLQMTFRHGD